MFIVGSYPFVKDMISRQKCQKDHVKKIVACKESVFISDPQSNILNFRKTGRRLKVSSGCVAALRGQETNNKRKASRRTN